MLRRSLTLLSPHIYGNKKLGNGQIIIVYKVQALVVHAAMPILSNVAPISRITKSYSMSSKFLPSPGGLIPQCICGGSSRSARGLATIEFSLMEDGQALMCSPRNNL